VERLARAMARAHAAGVPFDRAWSSALRGATHGAPYVAALSETRDAWERAYCGEPPTPAELAAGELLGWLLDAGDDVGVGVPEN
jgi:hypothetical protein